jgi:MFS family permease
MGSLGPPLIASVATTFHVSLDSAQWTLTISLLSGAVATPVLGRLGAGPHRRGTILATLAIVVAGSALTVLPMPFAWLLVGRAAQGVGLGLTALMMGVARDHLPEGRSAATIALVSVASTIGIGVGYPLAGLLTDLGGVRAVYGLGLLVTATALLAAWRSMPAAPEGRSARGRSRRAPARGRTVPRPVPRQRDESVEPSWPTPTRPRPAPWHHPVSRTRRWGTQTRRAATTRAHNLWWAWVIAARTSTTLTGTGVPRPSDCQPSTPRRLP